MPNRLASFIRPRAGSGGASTPLILAYPPISPHRGGRDHAAVSKSRFDAHLRWLRRHGLRGVGVAELLAARERGASEHLVGLTFDHGYADFIEHALPILDRYGFRATVFAPAGRLGGMSDADAANPPRPLMTARHVREAADAGMEIGSRGLCRPSLAGAETAALLAETENSRIVLQAASGQPVAGFCYPCGNSDGRVIAAVRAAGYSYACALWRSGHAGRYALPRVGAGNFGPAWRLAGRGLKHWLSWQWQVAGRPQPAAAARWTA